MKKMKPLFWMIAILLALSACSPQAAAATATPTLASQRGAGAGTGGGRAGFATRTPTLAPTPEDTFTPVPSVTPTSTRTPLPTDTLVPTPTGIPFSQYDVRVTITNDTANPIEYTFIGPIDGPVQVSIYLSIINGQTGFLRAPHGRFSVVVTTAGKTNQVMYNLTAGSWACQLSKGCEAFK